MKLKTRLKNHLIGVAGESSQLILSFGKAEKADYMTESYFKERIQVRMSGGCRGCNHEYTLFTYMEGITGYLNIDDGCILLM